MNKYDEQIQRLMMVPDEDFVDAVNHEWSDGEGLFAFCGPHGRTESGERCGCLTMVRGGRFVAETPELTALIRADDKIPDFVDDITKADLFVFKEWQEKLDRELPSRQRVSDDDEEIEE